jgi:acyl-CoA synthetase (AMP-forming)/AMP-acid ligase II
MGSIQADDEQGKLLVTSIEEKARWFAEHTVFRYAAGDWENDGYRNLTWSQWADAINKVAYWLDEQLGTSTDVDTVAYLGPNDIRYSVLLPAVMKTRRKASISYIFPTDRACD